jgi:polyhydroxybutyrate depolymerase
MKAIKHLLLLFTLIGLISAIGCNPSAGKPTATRVPTVTGTPSVTPSPSATPVPALQAGESRRTVKVGSTERAYLLHVPPGLTVGHPAPLVFVFHGYSSNAENVQRATGFNEIADTAGFIVVYPIGSGPGDALSWNGGGCCGFALDKHIDEPAFIREMISDLGTITRIDPKRIYATGMSNGGFLSYKLACEMSETFAAVAPVAGALLSSPCHPGQPVSVIDFHGRIDEVVPYESSVLSGGVPIPSTVQTIAIWAQLDGCNAPAKSEQTAILTHVTYSSCKDGSAVELYALMNVGHWWPNLNNDGVPASQIIWNFFANHPKP